MTTPSSISAEMADLIERLCLDELSPTDADRLEELIRANDESCRQYIVFMHIHALAERFEGADVNREANLLESRLSRETDALTSVPPASAPSFGFLDNATQGAIASFSQGMLFSYLVAALLVGCGLLISSLIPVSHPVQLAHPLPQPGPSVIGGKAQFIGRITGMVDCEWADARIGGFNGASVPLSRRYALASGLMEITYDTGVKVLLQGPCTYEVESPAGGYLSCGKLTARVEKKEERRKNEERSGSNSSFLIPHSYFAVRTPTAIVTDLGTEFGVEVDKDGDTMSHVFRGAVRVQVRGGSGSAEGPGQVLHEDESARVERANDQGDVTCIVVAEPAAKIPGFVRTIPTRVLGKLDLVDVVAGGDGFSGKRGRGIDPMTGRIGDIHSGNQEKRGDYKYHRVEEIPFVDGIFVPDGSNGPVQIDSAGHVFPGCPKTDNRSWLNVWAGGELPQSISARMSADLQGVDYFSPEHTALFMHANKGITFDLDAIRQQNPGCTVLRFRAVAGNMEPESENGSSCSADIWVLVDGQVRFKRREINHFLGAMPINVPIGNKDRFLTLAATDGGNSYTCDQIIFGDPRLELARPKTVVNNTE